MNSKQMQYAVVLSETQNFSQAAAKLNISQPAFSKQIISLEKELGITLFNRNENPISLTAAGEFFIKKAKKILFEEEVLIKTIEKYKTGENGKIVIGIPPFRSLYMLPELVAEMKEQFPSVNIVVCEQGLSKLEEGLQSGEYDFAIMNLPVNEAVFEAVPLEEDRLVLVVPNNLLNLIEDKKNLKSGDTISLTACRKLPFVMVSPEQEMRKLFDKLCAIEEVTPDIYLEVTGITTAREIAKEGIAATILPKQFAQNEAKKHNMVLLKLKNDSYIRQPAVVTRRGQFVSKYAEYAIKKLTTR